MVPSPRTTVPTQRSRTILSTPGRIDQFAQFLDIFQEHYFPLSPLVFPDPDLHLQGYDAFPPWSILRDGVPFDLMGITYDQLHDLWEFSTPTLPSLALLCDMTSHYWLDNGIRPYWTEAARAHLPDSLLKAIPPEGYPPHRIRAAVARHFLRPNLHRGRLALLANGQLLPGQRPGRGEPLRLRRPMGTGYSSPWAPPNGTKHVHS